MPLICEKDKAELFKEAFATLPAVISVDVLNDSNDYTIDITVTDFSRSVREPIYARQRELVQQFGDITFDFHVVDNSPETGLNAPVAE